MELRTARRRVAVLMALLLGGCGGGSSSLGPGPVPSPTATPSPSSPTPLPSAPPSGLSCPIGPGTLDSHCSRMTPRLDVQVEAAIDLLVSQKPALFNTTDEAGPGGYLVKDPSAYYAGVVANIAAQGLCASFDGAELQIKESNEFSEQYDILTSTNHVRRSPGSYRSTCSPALFPVDPSEYVASVRVAFYGFRCPAGVPEPPNGAGLLPVGCVGMLTATPKKKDGSDVNPNLYSEVFWTVREGQEHIDITDFPDEPFNKQVGGVSAGDFSICATVLGVQGCLNGKVVP